MELLPLGADIDLANIYKEKKVGMVIREKYGIKPTDKVIFTGGKITKQKNTHLLVEALNKMEDRSIHLFIVGAFDNSEEDYKKYIESIAAENSNIYFTGWVSGDEVYAFMDACNIAVFPSSQTVLWQQALSMSLPLVLGEEYINEAGKLLCHDIDYLNIKNNIYKISKGNLNVAEVIKGIKFFLSSESLTIFNNNAYDVALEMLDYNKIINKTLDFKV